MTTVAARVSSFPMHRRSSAASGTSTNAATAVAMCTPSSSTLSLSTLARPPSPDCTSPSPPKGWFAEYRQQRRESRAGAIITAGPTLVNCSYDVVAVLETQHALDDYVFAQQVVSEYINVKLARKKSKDYIHFKLGTLERRLPLQAAAFVAAREEHTLRTSYVLARYARQQEARLAARAHELRKLCTPAPPYVSEPPAYDVALDAPSDDASPPEYVKVEEVGEGCGDEFVWVKME
ncbi:uncharacterized protein LOC62_05G007645 [Vanrija pseudolonga]|uniref:Uncharacterized protein n=1 Tax=Vanrija pseudolonga TaxID=143232 RepID=A0AAF0YFN3_9TREE|nr:hypothetical protein LOC62_05G007645 [Vanrija pseudolonga]